MFRRRVKYVNSGSEVPPRYRWMIASAETVETPFALLDDEMTDWVMFVHITKVWQRMAGKILAIGTDTENAFYIIQSGSYLRVYAITNNSYNYYDFYNNAWTDSAVDNPQTNLNIAIKRDGNSLYASNDGENWTEAIACPSNSSGLSLNLYLQMA